VSTFVISGGTDGIGRALAVHYLRTGNDVVVIGRSEEKFRAMVTEAGGTATAHFIGADLTLAAENRRVVDEITGRFDAIDALILCAAYIHTNRVVTTEGFEHTFALYYLSRYLLSHGLASLLEAADQPVILNTAVPGAHRDAMRWNDLQLERAFTVRRANQQSRRANELLGLMLSGRPADKIRHILYNPGYVRTSQAGAFNRPLRFVVCTLARVAATPVEKAIIPIIDLVARPPRSPISAYRRRGQLPLPVTPGDNVDADRLAAATDQLLKH
jgi:NAD(P)-dependent dehydrogenase (short-subunit alcohol dehydrogenase family)